MINYLYTGVMEKPHNTQNTLFEQLLAEYDLMPEYTVNPKDLELIGKVHEAKVPKKAPSTLDQAGILKREKEIKPEMDTECATEGHATYGVNKGNDAPGELHNDIEDRAYYYKSDHKIKREIEYTVEDHSMSDEDSSDDTLNDLDADKDYKGKHVLHNNTPKQNNDKEGGDNKRFSEWDEWMEWGSDDEDWMERMEKEFAEWKKNHSCDFCDGLDDITKLMDHFYEMKGYEM